MSAHSSPQIVGAPFATLIDEPLHLRVVGLQADQPISISAGLQDDEGKRWQSQAIFRADSSGVVDLATQAPVSGSYDGVNGMGLFWSMVADSPEPEFTLFRKKTVTPLATTIRVESAERLIASALLGRPILAPKVERIPVRDTGLVGTFFVPVDGGPYPGVLVFGGSGGGLSEVQAALLAAHGYATLALAYFAYEDLPPSLFNIPLEYFETALTWLQAQPQVRADRLAVMGASRGAELALLLSAHYPQIQAVVAYMPSNVTWGGFGGDVPYDAPAWSYGGVSLPVMQEDLTTDEAKAIIQRRPIAIVPLYLISLANEAEVEAAAIPVERSRAALLLISGQDDQMWPSSVMADMIVARLDVHHYPYPYRHLCYPDAGHTIGIPYLPASAGYGRHSLSGATYAYGGTARGNALASVNAWRQVLGFLEQNLKQP